MAQNQIESQTQSQTPLLVEPFRIHIPLAVTQLFLSVRFMATCLNMHYQVKQIVILKRMMKQLISGNFRHIMNNQRIKGTGGGVGPGSNLFFLD